MLQEDSNVFTVSSILTHLSRIDLPTLISWMNQFPILGALFLLFVFTLIRTFCKFNIGEPKQRAHSAAVPDLGLHCLHMPNKKDA